ncbi:CRISPR-associated protein Cas5 [Paracidovorax citrulli]|uniref:CRISPR-associated protein Cas5 n=1 Tax=Paracidovorax citrulli TaxID=80869 RepID=UPI00088E88B9|nr:CRISPR-associated protein Cas5 [Paracidovorax citrulli]ATG93971.1 CRISPR-associated protein Cas5 [Paracidovorax citrulli]PVY63954.1 CRISPR-associated Cas5-like protein [Paracidovorax citrulli]QCX09924.1 hypothetical protein APS58_1010 [Paracidovorax citrulli]REG67084.1 CRISPR-associated Cas5-like protein [Paracidovorax citrulli]RLJ91644.1 CRISPR-associated Cas5-like protein [Paracidovorax citrulli]
MAYGVRLRIWGERACFTRPEMKVKRVSHSPDYPATASADPCALPSLSPPSDTGPRLPPRTLSPCARTAAPSTAPLPSP